MIQGLPTFNEFGPRNQQPTQPPVLMTVEEYETIRLIDNHGFTQEECALQMRIARTTVQQLYNDARYKISLSIVNGRSLMIQGGNYELSGTEENLGYGSRRGGGRGRRGGGYGPRRGSN